MIDDKNIIDKKDFLNNLLHYLRETFEGTTPDGNSFIDKGTGLFETFESISGKDASKSLRNNEVTIAAHLEHIRFYLVSSQEL